jgi:hypothetical protein
MMARYVTRVDWRAKAATTITPMALPAQGVIVHHSVGNPSTPIEQAMRDIQHLHQVRNGWFDFAYQEAVDVHGNAAEGRGFNVRSGATGRPWDGTHLTICALGNFDTTAPSDPLVNALVNRIVAAARDGKLVQGFTITGHRDHNATACPGRFLHARLPEIRRRVATHLTSPPTPTPISEDDMFIALCTPLAHQHHLAFPDGTSRPISPGALEGVSHLPIREFGTAAAVDGFFALFPAR